MTDNETREHAKVILDRCLSCAHTIIPGIPCCTQEIGVYQRHTTLLCRYVPVYACSPERHAEPVKALVKSGPCSGYERRESQ